MVVFPYEIRFVTPENLLATVEECLNLVTIFLENSVQNLICANIMLGFVKDVWVN